MSYIQWTCRYECPSGRAVALWICILSNHIENKFGTNLKRIKKRKPYQTKTNYVLKSNPWLLTRNPNNQIRCTKPLQWKSFSRWYRRYICVLSFRCRFGAHTKLQLLVREVPIKNRIFSKMHIGKMMDYHPNSLYLVKVW